MTKELSCQDVGFDCDYTARADSEDAILEKVAEHAADEHPEVEISDEIVASVKEEIKDI